MWLDDASLSRQELVLQRPFVNTGGFMGFYPDSKYSHLWQALGAFITNPISYRPRKPAENRTCLSYPGGILLHTGVPNPGFEVVLRRYALRWGRSACPIIVHLIAEEPGSLGYMTRKLETCENVVAIELGFSPGMEKEDIETLILAAQCELPLVACLSLRQAALMATRLVDLTIAMLHLGDTRGMLAGAGDSLIAGRLYGPALLPQVTEYVSTYSDSGVEIMAGGGVYSKADAECLFRAGAKTVALDTLLWYGEANCGDLLS
jgi:dihydroorotate dehydrogenase